MSRLRLLINWILIILLSRSVNFFVGEEIEIHDSNNRNNDRSYNIFDLVTSRLKINNPQRIFQYYFSSLIPYLPVSLEQDFRVLQLVCHANSTVLDLFQKELEVVNFTVFVPQNDDVNKIDINNVALRVGHFRIRWDSYLRPSIQVKVSDVDIVVEFTNLLLTQTNWNELQDLGFPPKLRSDANLVDEGADKPDKKPSTSFIRIRNLDLTGNVRLRTQSRPLGKKDIFPDLLFDLGMLNDLNNRIHSVATKNKKYEEIDNNYVEGNAGCTTEEFYEVLEVFFIEKIQDLLQDVTFDLMTNYLLDKSFEKSDIVQEGKKVFKQMKRSAERYMLGVAEKTGSMLGERLADRLFGWI